MKKLGFFGKLLYAANVLFAFLLLLSFIVPYVSPKTFPSFSLLSLLVSPLLVINILFVVYWLVRRKKQLILSTVVLLIAYFHFSPFYQIGSKGDVLEYQSTLKVLTYNVRLFNAYEEQTTNDAIPKLAQLLQKHKPDVLCIQEFYRNSNISLNAYPYHHIVFKDDQAKMGHAIYSKYPFVDSGAVTFQKTYNNAIYSDIVKEDDTVRVYNIHLQSLGISPTVSSLQEGDKERLRRRLATTFGKQQEQVEQVLQHKATSPYATLIVGDFNSTPFSYTYHQLKKEMKDAFEERGSGLGTTFKFDGYPMRIDFMLCSPALDVIDFETISTSFSDHFPIVATFGIQKNE